MENLNAEREQITNSNNELYDYVKRIVAAVNYKGNCDHEDVPSILRKFAEGYEQRIKELTEELEKERTWADSLIDNLRDDIRELTTENKRLRAKNVELLIQEGKKRNEIKPAKDITKITRYIDLVEFEQKIKKYVKAETPEQKELVEWCKDECIRQAYCMPFTNDAMIADTVRKMQERLKEYVDDFYNSGEDALLDVPDLIDQIAKEMLEDKLCT